MQNISTFIFIARLVHKRIMFAKLKSRKRITKSFFLNYTFYTIYLSDYGSQ